MKNRKNVVLKARQIGISEITAAYATWMMLFRRDKNILVMATKKDVARNIIRKVHTAIDNVPKWLMLAKVTTKNVYSIEMSSGSRIKATASAKDAGRSEALSLLIVDEAAHIEGFETIWTGLQPTVTAGGSIIMLSSPNGIGNVFHKTYTDAKSGVNDFSPTLLMWWVHPEHIVDEDGIPDLEDDPLRKGFKTSSWFRQETKGMSRRDIAQEHECDFIASGDNFIDPSILQRIAEEEIVPPVSIRYIDNNLHVWEEPLSGQSYLLTGDVARGDGNDCSAAHVFKISTKDQVAEYNGKLTPDVFASFLCDIGEKYGNALMVVENANVGWTCLDHVRMLEYENLYFSPKNQLDDAIALNMKHPFYDEKKHVPGLTTSVRTRPLMLAKLEEYIRLGLINIRSERMLDELYKFIWNNGKPQAQAGYNDDLVMAGAFACWVFDSFLKSSYLTDEMTKTMLESTTMHRVENHQIPGASKDPLYARRVEQQMLTRPDPYKMGMPDGTFIDLGWLIRRG